MRGRALRLRPRLRRDPGSGIEPDGEHGGEPTDGARKIDLRPDVLAAMTFQIEQHRPACAPVPPTPVGERQHQAGQQHIIHAAMERGRHTGEQRSGDGSRQREREMAGGVDAAGLTGSLLSSKESDGWLNIPVQNASSPLTSGSCAWSVSSCTHWRKEVPRDGSANGRPATTASQAEARSGNRMRHDTPSTARWWMVSSSRPGRCAPASNQTACTMIPLAGASLASAACACSAMQLWRAASSSLAMSVRRLQTAASTVPTGATSKRHSLPLRLDAVSRRRNAS